MNGAELALSDFAGTEFYANAGKVMGFKIGEASLAYLTLLVWTLPSVIFMTIMAISLLISNRRTGRLNSRFIQPMAVGFISYAPYSISVKNSQHENRHQPDDYGRWLRISSKHRLCLAILLLPDWSAQLKYRAQPKEEKKISVRWTSLMLWLGVLVFAALLGWATKKVPEVTRPIRCSKTFIETEVWYLEADKYSHLCCTLSLWRKIQRKNMCGRLSSAKNHT